MYDLAIIGSGTAGLTAAIYSARADLSTLVLIGEAFGGQIATTNDVENYPGFDDGITGPELTERMRKQAERFGAKFEMNTIIQIDVNGPPFTLTGHGAEYQARAVVVATGASPKLLGVPGELELWGRGVSYCATCDGAFFRGEHIAVVGGGDSALQEALFLTRFGSKISIIHRRDQLRAGAYLTNRQMKTTRSSSFGTRSSRKSTERTAWRAFESRTSRPARSRVSPSAVSSSISDTDPTPKSSKTSWTWTTRDTSSRITGRTPTSRGYSSPARPRTTISGRPSRRPARVAWPRWKPRSSSRGWSSRKPRSQSPPRLPPPDS